MGKIIYVNGHIIVTTKFFVPKEMGCGYSTPPEGAEIVEATTEYAGVKCLLIDDNHPQSLFNEYYAKEGISTDTLASSYLSATYLDSINIYKDRISETCGIIEKVAEWDVYSKSLVYRMAYVDILAALDAFICYVLIKRSTSDEYLFEEFTNYLAPRNKRESWQGLKNNDNNGEWEQSAIKFILETPFLNTDRIDTAFKRVRFEKLDYNRKVIEEFFRMRHVIVHRSGKQMDDNQIDVTYQLLKELINVCHTLVGAIFDSICITCREELIEKPKERSIEEVFPGGVVRAPFKLSDLMRLLRPIEPFMPIEMPTLK